MVAGFLSADLLAATVPGPSYTASISNNGTLTIKAKNMALYSLLGLPLTSGQDLRSTIDIGATVISGGTLVVLTSNTNVFTYSVGINASSNLANAKGKLFGPTLVPTKLSFSATSDNLRSQLTYQVDITPVAPLLPQTKGKKARPTLAGTSQFTLIVESATFVGAVDAKGKVTFSTP
jgi:hypothetical protein